MCQTDYKKLPFAIGLIGFLFIFLGVLFSPSFVANHISSDGILEDSTVQALQSLRLATISLGFLIMLFGFLSARWPIIFSRATKLMSNRITLLILFGMSFAYLFSGITYGLNVYDEGSSVYGATRVLDGDIPYRDFWTIYAPGQFYVLALLFKFFGPSIIVERVFSSIVLFLIVVCTYALTKRVVSQNLALISLFLVTIWVGMFRFYASPMPPAILFALLSCIYLTRYISKKRKWELMIAGLLTGVTTLFRHDIGFYTFLTETAVIVLFAYTNLSTSEANWRGKFWKSLKTWGIYLLSIVIITLPVVLFFIYTVSIHDLISQLILFPTTTFPQYRSLPYPTPIPNPMFVINGEETIFHYVFTIVGRIPFYFPLIVFAIMTFWVAFSVRNKRSLSEKEWFVILFLLLGVAFFNQARVRSDVPHLFPTIIPAIILFSLLLSTFVQIEGIGTGFRIRIKGRRSLRILFIIFILIVLLSFTFNSLKLTAPTFLTSSSTADFVPLEIERAEGIYLPLDRAKHLQQAVMFIQEYVPEDGRIFVGNSKHDRIFVNDIMFYFLAERHSATKYHELHPGLATTRSIQKEIINELIDYGVNYIILWNGAENVREPNKSGESSGVTDLDEFIRGNYKAIKSFGPYTIYSRVTHSMEAK